YLMSGHICYIPFSLELASRCKVVIPHAKWVGSGRVTLRYVFPIPPLEPGMQLLRFCRKIRFLGKIQKSGIRNSMTYRLPNSRKSNFATEPLSLFLVSPSVGCKLRAERP